MESRVLLSSLGVNPSELDALQAVNGAVGGDAEVRAGGIVSPEDWISQGPAPGINGQENVPPDDQINGAVQTLLVHPTDPDVMYIGSVNGGIWKSTNATAPSPHWTPLIDDFRSLSIGALEFDPTDASSNTLIAGLGITSSFFLGDEFRGVLYSTDAGATWSELGLTDLAGQNITSVKARGSILLAASDNVWGGGSGNGLFRSTDSGATWTQISGSNGLPAGDVSDIVSDPLNPNILYAAVPNSGGGVFVSTDTGLNWTNMTTGIGIIDGTTTKVELAVYNDGVTKVVNAVIVNSSQVAGVFRSVNGAAFTALDVPAAGGQGFVHLAIAAHPANSNLVFIGGAAGSQYLTRIDAGQPSGSQITNIGTGSFGSPHVDIREMYIDANGDLVMGSDGGLFRLPTPTTNSGSWRSAMGDLSIFELHSVAWDSVSNVIMAGAQDNGTLYQVSEGNPVWDHPGFGDGGDVIIDDISLQGSGQSIRYLSSQFLGGWRRQVFDSSNNPVSAPVGLASISDGQFVTPVALNSVDPTRLLVGGSTNLYESINQGTSLTSLGGPGANGSVGSPLVYGGFQNGTPNPDLIYAGRGSTVYIRTSSGGAITPTSALPVGASSIIDLIADPDNWMRVFAIDSDQVFMSEDAGASWSDITGDLGTISQLGFHSLEFLPGPNLVDALLIGTKSGVFAALTDAIGTWCEVGTTLPDVIVHDLEYDSADDILVAGTMGRGAWTFPNASTLIEPPPPPALIIDDGEPGFAIEAGSWGTGNSGAKGDNRNASTFAGNKVARWTFTGLIPGQYRVSATWKEHAVRATDAPYTLFDGPAQIRTVDVNQQLAPGGSPELTELGVPWQDLGGTVDLIGDTLTVKLSNNANGYVMADAIRIERVGDLPPVRIIDDGEPGFAIESGSWGTGVVGAKADNRNASTSGGTKVASWTFASLEPGLYRVSATWKAAPTRATNAPFSLFDGAMLRSTVPVNQQLAPSGSPDLTDLGEKWQDLGGTFFLTGETLVVKLSNDANGYVMADAVRIERIGEIPPPQIIDDGDPGFSIVNGTWGTGVAGANGDNRNSSNVGENSVARWTFTGLVPGMYRVSATWHPHPIRATDAPYTVFSGTTELGTFDVNQQLLPSGSPDLTDLGVHWQDLGGVLTVTDSTMVVQLSNDANGYVMADAIRIQRIGELPPPQILDDGDPGFAIESGVWGTGNSGVNGDNRNASNTGGVKVASWTFINLSPGKYRVSATWVGTPSRASDAPYSVYDGVTPLVTTDLNQKFAPNDFSEGGINWEDIATVTITGNTLVVKLSNDANGSVMADAIRIERV